MQKLLIIFVFLLFCADLKAQNLTETAENIRIKYKIPEIAFAVVSADSVLEMQVLGTRRINFDFPAKQTDKFHIGSNTKAITSFIAALLVKDGKINWETKFFELFPELKPKSKKDYYAVTLKDLLTFRAGLPTYTYTFPKPTKKDFSGDEAAQRLQFAAYFLKQKSVKPSGGLTPSNVGYVLAGLMLEKASGKSYQELVRTFGESLQIDFGFDQPNLSDVLQTWGHDADLNAVAPTENYKLNWLLAAGNINVSLPDYVKFVQLQLKGLDGKSNLLSQENFELLHYGLPKFSFGWFNEPAEKTKHQASFNEGNAGAFITKVCIIKDIDRAFVVFTNAASAETSEGIEILLDKMKEKYGR
jgi:CubicO group peptidase (beta-lactamase class C family)